MFPVSESLTGGISSLYHELFDHSVEDVAIIVAIAGMHTKVLHCLWTAMCVCVGGEGGGGELEREGKEGTSIFFFWNSLDDVK